MIIGYSVLFVNDEISIEDALWNKRIVYNTWAKALEEATNIANEEKDIYDNTRVISFINSKSKELCESSGDIRVFTLHVKDYGEVGNVYIVPVYNE